jgi:4-amino-4-deoxy-L-arabinose transferase-like glycosyltransferase
LLESFERQLDAERHTYSLARFWLAGQILLLIIIAFGLRMYAIHWGLPYVEHHDEPESGNSVIGMLRNDDWNPRFFQYPSLYLYALRLVFAAHWGYGHYTGLYTAQSQLPEGTYYYLQSPGFFAWGRAFTASLGTATVVLLFLVGRRWWGSRVGLVAAAILAVSPFHMRHSQFITTDVPSAFVTLLALAAALRLLENQQWRSYALAGLVAGLAAGTKYNAGAVVLAIAAAHSMSWGRASLRQLGRLAWAGIWCTAGFLITTPYAIITPDMFIGDLMTQYSHYTDSVVSGDLTKRWPLAGYLQFFWIEGLLPLPCLAAGVGIVACLRRRDRPGLMLLVFALPYWLFALSQTQHFFRNLMPIFPILAIYTGVGVVVVSEHLTGLLTRAYRHAQAQRAGSVQIYALSLGLLTVMLLSQPLRDALRTTQFFAQPLSKVAAGRYIREQLPHGAPIAVNLNPVAWANQPFITPLTGDITQHDTFWYRAEGYRYVAANLNQADITSYRALKSAAQVIASFPNPPEAQPGSPLEILDLGQHLDELRIERREASFGDQLRLLGFQSGAGKLRAAFSPLHGSALLRDEQALLLNLYWQPLQPLPYDYAIFLHLQNSQGQIVAQRDTVIRATDYPTSHWQAGELAIDLADLAVPPALPPGRYSLEMGVYRMETGERLPLRDSPMNALILTTVTKQ